MPRTKSSGTRVLLATTCTPDDRKTLCAARSLAQRGVSVTVGSDRFQGLAYWSRAVAGRLRYPHPGEDPARFAAQLEHVLREQRYDAILPANDYTTIALAKHAGSLEGWTRLALPAPENLLLAHDKYALAALCRRLGLEIPRTRLAHTEEEILAAADDTGYPCVVKYRRGSGAVGLRILTGPASRRPASRVERAADLVFDPTQSVVQEFVPGAVHDVCGLFCHGELRAAVTQRRLRMYPAAGGVGVDCVTTTEPGLVERAATLMRELQWHGPAQIEFKVDAASGRVWLIEVNGRLWGTLALSVWAGIDMPWLLLRMALDGGIDPQPPGPAGVRYRWPLPLGLLHALQSGETWPALRDLFAPCPGAGGDWRWSDPAPQAAEAVYALRRMWERGRLGPERRNPMSQ
ncbi:MAG: ATP-grasp domain-containing protein [Bryobacterales bacterium]|nr:ATP-grasp domain-containing protein [Bryobacterales bacterium]